MLNEEHRESTLQVGGNSASDRDNLTCDIRVDPRRIFYVLLICITTLSIIGSAVAAIAQEFSISNKVTKLFILDEEQNLPTLFSFFILMSCSVTLIMIALHERKLRTPWWVHWIVLGVIFFGMAFDEAAQVHESLSEPLRRTFDLGRALFFAWVLPGAIFVAALAAFYLRFLLALERSTGTLFVVAGMLYTAGALGVEMISSTYHETSGPGSMAYQITTVLEETLEMLGLAVFFFALLRYLTMSPITFRLRGPDRSL